MNLLPNQVTWLKRNWKGPSCGHEWIKKSFRHSNLGNLCNQGDRDLMIQRRWESCFYHQGLIEPKCKNFVTSQDGLLGCRKMVFMRSEAARLSRWNGCLKAQDDLYDTTKWTLWHHKIFTRNQKFTKFFMMPHNHPDLTMRIYAATQSKTCWLIPLKWYKTRHWKEKWVFYY